MSVASATRIDRRHGKRPAPRPLRALPMPALHDPRERLVAVKMAAVRRHLHLDEVAFAKIVGVNTKKPALFEAQQQAWPLAQVSEAIPRLDEACAQAAGGIEEAAALLAEIFEQTVELQ